MIAGRRFKVRTLLADGTREHLHRGPIAQLSDPTSAQAIGASGEQALVPVIQRGQGEGRIPSAGGLQQLVQHSHQLDPSERHARRVRDGISLLEEYGELA